MVGIPLSNGRALGLGIGRGTDLTVATRLSWIQMWIASEHVSHNFTEIKDVLESEWRKLRPAFIHSRTISVPFTPEGDIFD